MALKQSTNPIKICEYSERTEGKRQVRLVEVLRVQALHPTWLA